MLKREFVDTGLHTALNDDPVNAGKDSVVSF